MPLIQRIYILYSYTVEYEIKHIRRCKKMWEKPKGYNNNISQPEAFNQW